MKYWGTGGGGGLDAALLFDWLSELSRHSTAKAIVAAASAAIANARKARLNREEKLGGTSKSLYSVPAMWGAGSGSGWSCGAYRTSVIHYANMAVPTHFPMVIGASLVSDGKADLIAPATGKVKVFAIPSLPGPWAGSDGLNAAFHAGVCCFVFFFTLSSSLLLLMLWQPFATVAVGTPQHVEAAIDAASAAFPAWAALSWGERSTIVLQLASSLQARLEVTSDCFFLYVYYL
jgi:hypothetical protein